MAGTIFFVAGGTGGHVFPAVSLAEYLKKQGYILVLITDLRGFQYDQGGVFNQVIIRHVKRRSKILKGFIYPLSFFLQGLCGMMDLWRLKPSLVIGFGGYPSLPSCLAAVLWRIPLMIHEQNARLGKANRLLAKFAHKVLLSFPTTDALSHGVVVGNFVRSSILKLKDRPYVLPKKTEKFCILVIGGSQGSLIVSEMVARAIDDLPEQTQKKLHIVQQCRPEAIEDIQSIYNKTKVSIVLQPFFSHIEDHLKRAHLVICRAGASTVAELIVSGKPAILIPFAASKESDQLYNTKKLLEMNAAWMMTEGELTASTLSKKIQFMLDHSHELVSKATAIKHVWTLDSLKEASQVIDALIL